MTIDEFSSAQPDILFGGIAPQESPDDPLGKDWFVVTTMDTCDCSSHTVDGMLGVLHMIVWSAWISAGKRTSRSATCASTCPPSYSPYCVAQSQRSVPTVSSSGANASYAFRYFPRLLCGPKNEVAFGKAR